MFYLSFYSFFYLSFQLHNKYIYKINRYINIIIDIKRLLKYGILYNKLRNAV